MNEYKMPEKVVRADDWNEFNAKVLLEINDKLNTFISILTPKEEPTTCTEIEKPKRKRTTKKVEEKVEEVEE